MKHEILSFIILAAKLEQWVLCYANLKEKWPINYVLNVAAASLVFRLEIVALAQQKQFN